MHGYPLTAQRKLLLQVLHEAEGHLDAKELYRRASSRDPSISPATVYRSLNLFKELGLVDERKLGKTRCYYEAKNSPQHQHMVCRGCDRVIDFESPLISELVEQVRREHNFNVTKAELYLEGFCTECDQGRGNGDDSGH
ncbi:MAG: Fur family transcriptional regulator [Dehalococcoidia bacterium]